MNILKLMPRKLMGNYEKNILNSGQKIKAERYLLKVVFIGLIFSALIAVAMSFFNVRPIISFVVAFAISQILFYFRVSLLSAARIKRLEEVFPDFIQLVSSNLRAGITIDRAFLSSARQELAPLDEEIARTGAEIATGKDIILAFKNMASRIDSEKIKKTIFLIISGLKAGGNISMLLENTASNMREKEFLEKRVASNVLMYIIFIFVAIGFGAPLLFGLSSILIEIIIKLTSQLPSMQASSMNLPFALTSVRVSINFIIYFSLAFLIAIDIISSLVIGLVIKGDERYGLRYVFPLLALSVGIFFIVRILLYRVLLASFSIAT